MLPCGTIEMQVDKSLPSCELDASTEPPRKGESGNDRWLRVSRSIFNTQELLLRH